MKYVKESKDKTYLINGKAKVRVTEHSRFPSLIKGRVIKVLQVVEVIRMSVGNFIERGMVLAMSFPESHVNAKEYVWKGALEECQTPFSMKDKPKQKRIEYKK